MKEVKKKAKNVQVHRLFMYDVVNAVEYFAPNLIAASSEGGSEFYTVDYFGYTATLAQSSQLYKQIMVGVNERVFALMPFSRAENSNTPRHLTEGKQMEFEMGFFDHWHEILDIQENCLKFIVKYLNINYASDIATLGNDIVIAPETVPFPRIPFIKAQEIFYSRTGIDDRTQDTSGTDFVFVVDWKTSKQPFYAYPNDENPEISNTFDLLC